MDTGSSVGEGKKYAWMDRKRWAKKVRMLARAWNRKEKKEKKF